MELKSHYWDDYYAASGPPAIPSQFAVLVGQEFPDRLNLVDLGAGNLRDSLFFHSLGFKVLAIDGADVENLTGELSHNTEIDFIRHRFGEEATQPAFEKISAWVSTSPTVVYGRFFLHAIDLVAQSEVLGLTSLLLARHSDSVACFEYRNTADESGPRLTEPHYRRYIDDSEVIPEFARNGLEVIWKVTGKGMAKMGIDDAHVTRVFLAHQEKSGPRK